MRRRGPGGWISGGQATLAAWWWWRFALNRARASLRRSIGREVAPLCAGGLCQMRRQAEASQAPDLPTQCRLHGGGHCCGALFPLPALYPVREHHPGGNAPLPLPACREPGGTPRRPPWGGAACGGRRREASARLRSGARLACYGMVMEDVAGSIPPMKMFFAMSEEPERDFHLTSTDRNTVLKARNQLAHQLIASDQFIGNSLEGARKDAPGKFDDHLTWLQYKKQNSFKDGLWAAMSAHTLREAMAQWLGHGTSLGARTRLSLWRHGSEHKRQSGDLLDGLRLINVDEKRRAATFSLPEAEALADNFREGDSCTLVPALIVHSAVWHRPLLRGRIVQRNHDEIRLSFQNPISAAFPLQIGEAYRIEPSQVSSHIWQAVEDVAA